MTTIVSLQCLGKMIRPISIGLFCLVLIVFAFHVAIWLLPATGTYSDLENVTDVISSPNNNNCSKPLLSTNSFIITVCDFSGERFIRICVNMLVFSHCTLMDGEDVTIFCKFFYNFLILRS